MDLTRQEMLELWLKRQGLTKADLARKMETSLQNVCKIMKAETIPPWRYDQLVKLGIPDDLLPRPVHKISGPRKKRTTPTVLQSA